MILQLLEVTPALGALNGVVMELDDCAFPLLSEVVKTDNPEVGFAGADYALLVGSMPRKEGMERSELLAANGAIFTTQGRAIATAASPEVRVLVVGNPANTNCLIALNNAGGIDPRQFSAMTRLDHNRAKSSLAARLGKPVSAVKQMTIWGNHSPTQYPDLFNCRVEDEVAFEAVNDPEWVADTYIPQVGKRGAAIIAARGASSAASAANAAIEHIRRLGLRNTGGGLGFDGSRLRRKLRGARGTRFLLPLSHLGRELGDCARTRGSRVFPGAN